MCSRVHWTDEEKETVDLGDQADVEEEKQVEAPIPQDDAARAAIAEEVDADWVDWANEEEERADLGDGWDEEEVGWG